MCIVYRMFFLGGNFVSSLILTLKSKKTLKTFKKPRNLKTFSKNLGFFQPWMYRLATMDGTPSQSTRQYHANSRCSTIG